MEIDERQFSKIHQGLVLCVYIFRETFRCYGTIVVQVFHFKGFESQFGFYEKIFHHSLYELNKFYQLKSNIKFYIEFTSADL